MWIKNPKNKKKDERTLNSIKVFSLNIKKLSYYIILESEK